MTVSATDADDPMTENAFLSYSIIDQESDPANAITKTMFGINNETGAIYTRDVGLDREVKCGSTWRCIFSNHSIVHFVKMCWILFQVVKSFRLKVQVADMGGMGLTGEGVAVIHVSDINNHAPQFSPVSVRLTQPYKKFSVLNDIMLTSFICYEIRCFTVISLLRPVFCVHAVQYDSGGEQAGLRDRPGECDGQRRSGNKKLGGQIFHFQWSWWKLRHRYRPSQQPGRPVSS